MDHVKRNYPKPPKQLIWPNKDSKQRLMKRQFETLYLQISALLIFLGVPGVIQAQITIDCPATIEHCTGAFDCTGTFTLEQPPATSATCFGLLTFEYQISFQGNVIASGILPEEGTFLSSLPFADLEVTITVTDDCGNSEDCTTIHQIIDCSVPTLDCVSGLNIELEELPPNTDADGDGDFDDSAAEIFAQDFLLFPELGDNCSDISYSINVLGELPDMNQESIVLTCDDLGVLQLEVYIWDSSFNPNAEQPDGTLGGPNYSSCITILTVLPGNIDGCMEMSTINGYITSPTGDALEGITVFAGSETAITDASGYYEFQNLPVGTDLTITPYFDANPLNGITTYDLVQLQQHIIGPGTLDSPYKIIAADISNDQSVSAFDLAQLEGVLSGDLPDFPNNTSWRFVTADYVFPNPENPFTPSFPEVVNINNFSGNTQIDFIGIKIGDLDCSAIINTTDEQEILTGRISMDINSNCTSELTEPGRAGWIVELTNGLVSFYGSTNENGAYMIEAFPGSFEVIFHPPLDNFSFCASSYPVELETGELLELNIAPQAIYDCPHLEVDISTANLASCSQGIYYVNYRNTGPAVAINAYIDITLDEWMSLTNSSIPFSDVNDNTYSFLLSDVPAGTEGHFTIAFDLACDLPEGLTHCTTAEIFPNGDCFPEDPLWDGSSLTVNAVCENDSVKFLVHNIGDEMQEPVQYIVIEDDLLMLTDEIQLDAGESTILAQAADGSTKRLEVDQRPGHPGLSQPSLSIEACGTDELGNYSLGFVTQFSEDDADPFISVDCQENSSEVVFNQKRAFPKGVGPQNLIEPNTSIEYHINFQNTSGETAEQVVIEDMLDAGLDPATFQPGASSHTYTWIITGNGLLTFTFDNINLPDISDDSVASTGFVKFRIDQQADNPEGTLIINQATIIMAPGAEALTNITIHQVDNEVVTPASANISLEVATVFENAIVDAEVQANGTFAGMTDIAGQLTLNDQPTGQPYYFALSKEAAYDDGQTTFDLLVMALHLLGDTQMGHPYLLLAADMDNSGSVSLFDMILLRRSLLGVDLPDESGWYFYKHIAFDDIENPWAQLDELDLLIESLQEDTSLEVVGIKKGDLNGTANPALTDDLDDRGAENTLEVELKVYPLGANEWRIDFLASAEQEVSVYDIELAPLKASFALPFVGMSLKKTNGHLQTIGTVLDGPTQGGRLLTQIEVETADLTKVIDQIQLEPTSKALTPDFKTLPMVLKKDQLFTDELRIFPNPSEKGFEIHHYLAQLSDIRIEVYDIKGRKIKMLAEQPSKEAGWTSYRIEADVLPAGAYIVRLQTDHQVMTKRIVKVEQ